MKKILFFGMFALLAFAMCEANKMGKPVGLAYKEAPTPPRGMLTKIIDTEPVEFSYDNVLDLGGEIGEVVSIERAWYREINTGSVRLVSGIGSGGGISGSVIISKADNNTSVFVVPPSGVVGHGRWSLHLEFTFNPPENKEVAK